MKFSFEFETQTKWSSKRCHILRREGGLEKDLLEDPSAGRGRLLPGDKELREVGNLSRASGV